LGKKSDACVIIRSMHSVLKPKANTSCCRWH